MKPKKTRVRRRPNRSDVLREVTRQFPVGERDAVMNALDLYTSDDAYARARMQLTILDRSKGRIAAVRELAYHLLVESGDVRAAPDRETLRNEHYAG